MTGNIIIGQSGGPTAAINASIAGVYVKAKQLGIKKVYGMVHGIEGFLEDKICDMDEYLSEPINIELLKRTPSAFLGSCRFKMPKIEGNEEIYEKVFHLLDKYNIKCMFYAGGNDSMDTVKMLSDYAKAHNKVQRFMGVPKTIDNDLPITDHCPGYGSVAKYVATSVKEAIRDNESFGAKKTIVCVIETMGRNAGWIAAASVLAKGDDCSGPDAIYLPEIDFEVDTFIEKVKDLASKKSSVIIVVSEGAKLSDGRYICELASDNAWVDAFGHKTTSGAAKYLCDMVGRETGLKTRCVEISTLQRAGSHLASLTDINEAFQAGEMAMQAASEGHTGEMVIFTRDGEEPYECGVKTFDIHEIANVEKKIPRDWISEDGLYVNEKFIRYARPLIMGELTPFYVDGIPRHLVMK